MNDKQWRDKLREHFADFERPEPEGLWEDIEREMTATRHTASRPLRGRLLYWGSRIGAAAAMIALVLWVGRIALRTDRPDTDTDTTTTTIAASQPQPEVQSSEPATVEPVREDEPVSTTQRQRPSQPDPASSVIASATESPEAGLESTGTESSEGHPAERSEPAPLPEEDHQTTPPTQTQTPPARHYASGDPFAVNEPVKPRKRPWSARLVASRLPGSGSKRMYGGYGTFEYASVQSEMPTMPEHAYLGKDAMSDIMLMNSNSKTHTETRHNPPVRAGLMLSYGLTDRLSVESGLTYAYLGSKLKSGSGQYYYETRQSLHYLGIPANLRYSLWSNNLLRLYLSGGGMVERNISGSSTTEYMDGGKAFSREKKDVSVKGLQWSVNASVGLQVDISRRVGVFADPGLSYHFDNSSKVETVYKKNPLNFDLTFGLRFSLDR